MTHAPHDPTHPMTDAQERADELRTLAGPVESGADAPHESGADAPDDSPEPGEDVDEVRGDPDLGSEADPYELRSMPVDPNPTADDPASFLNP